MGTQAVIEEVLEINMYHFILQRNSKHCYKLCLAVGLTWDGPVNAPEV